MSASEVSIANNALILLGANTLIALNENTKAARTMTALYHDVRQAELRARRWKFSLLRASLPALSAAPLHGYSYQYQLPADFLKLIEGGDLGDSPDFSDVRGAADTALYSIEGAKILTNLAAPLAIRYIADVTDVGLFDPCFRRMFSASLAYDACEAITQSTEKQDRCRLRWKEALRDGLRAGSIEVPPQQQADDTWITARTQ